MTVARNALGKRQITLFLVGLTLVFAMAIGGGVAQAASHRSVAHLGHAAVQDRKSKGKAKGASKVHSAAVTQKCARCSRHKVTTSPTVGSTGGSTSTSTTTSAPSAPISTGSSTTTTGTTVIETPPVTVVTPPVTVETPPVTIETPPVTIEVPPIKTEVPPIKTEEPVTTAPPAGQVYLGATIGASVFGETENPPWNMKPLEKFEADSGHRVNILQVHQEWGKVETSVLQRVRSHGSVPMLITEFANLKSITNGSQDAKIKAMSASIAAYGGPVLLRWDWEMNGDWYAWGGQSQAAEWVAAYRHLHDTLTAANVSWVWNPNVYYPNVAAGKGVPANPTAWWPGSQYVDWMGMDGYSYGTESFSTVFGPTYELFQKLAPEKPIILPEWAASNDDGRKAAYIKEAFEKVPTRYPAIKAMVYYNDTLGGGMDWPLEELAAAGSAYRLASSASYFSAAPNLEGKLSIP